MGAAYDDVTDKDLLAKHADGDTEAFGELVRRHRDRLWAVALRTLGDREEAADAVQDALISAYRAAGTFRGQAAVTTWLYRITVNACLDRARKAASRRTSPVEDSERLDRLLEPHEAASAPAERQDLHRELMKALGTLPVEQRAALVLVDMQGYPVAEAAKILEVATGTVKSRCARGRARLLPLLSHLRGSGGAGAPGGGSSAPPAAGTSPPVSGTGGATGHASSPARATGSDPGSGSDLTVPGARAASPTEKNSATKDGSTRNQTTGSSVPPAGRSPEATDRGPNESTAVKGGGGRP